MHYGDMFYMGRFNLVVVDECHYCVGNHPYSIIMKQFYHALPKEKRPHVLGLTASPLLNVRDTHSDEELEAMLRSLEVTMDSTLVSVESSWMGEQFRKQTILEQVVEYKGCNTGRWLPPADNLSLHPSRFREFRQLQELYRDLGPLPVSLYCQAVRRELSRNEFENESPQEFAVALSHLDSLVQFCEQECHTFLHHGRTDKLVALEEILEAEIERHGGSDPVGLVFTARRVTAVALCNYFQWRNQKLDEGGMDTNKYSWGESATIRRSEWHQSLPAEHAPAAIALDTDDRFADSADDPFVVFQSNALPKVAAPQVTSGQGVSSDNGEDQFMDADDDPFDKNVALTQSATWDRAALPHKIQTRIRTAALVRNITSIFNSLSIKRKSDKVSEEIRHSWLHVDQKVREVLTKLRRQELNLLFATCT